MAEFAYEVKVPKNRLAVLIGTKGEIKRRIEKQTSTTIIINSKEGDVKVTGEDPLSLYCTKDIIKAIARGFNPDVALLLLKQDYCFDIISLHDFEKNSQIQRIRGRIIGKEGKSRRLIEQHTECYVSVFGKTISVIGRTEHVFYAKKAIEMLIKGSQHSTVYRWLEKMRRNMIQKEFEDDFKNHLRD